MRSPDPLELLREESGLSIDAEGRMCHRGEPITHARTLQVLWRSLSRRPDGRYQVQVGREVGLVRVDDAPYGIRGTTLESGEVHLHLTDGTVEALEPSTLRIGRDGVLRCRVKGSHEARFCRAAQTSLGLCMEEGAGGYALRLGGRSWPVPTE